MAPTAAPTVDPDPSSRHEAQRELIYTTASIKQLANILGFSDETYFGRFFRKHTGLNPREFRAKALEPTRPPNDTA